MDISEVKWERMRLGLALDPSFGIGTFSVYDWKSLEILTDGDIPMYRIRLQ